MTTVRRVEWRGDLFASDLPRLMGRLAEAHVTSYDLPHTMTIFLQQEGQPLRLDQTLRVRSYGDFADLTPNDVLRAIRNGLAAKLQLKAACGDTVELANGRLMMMPTGAEPGSDDPWQLWLEGRRYAPTSVRVARRTHHVLPAAPGAEPVRVTVDHERHLFRMVAGMLRPLGHMGPRVEIKAASTQEVERTLARLNSDGVLRRLPYRSLELLFQDLVRDEVRPGVRGDAAEIEVKFDVRAGDPAALAAAVTGWLGARTATHLLLPFPHQIVRMRRYHVCGGADDDAERTVVETTAGRLSAKVKRDPVVRDGALVRRTAASRTTDIDGSCEPIDAFVADRGWYRHGAFTKVQAKIPFAVAGCNAYLASIDDCVAADGRRLQQVELEYIGHLDAPDCAQSICAELADLAGDLTAHLTAGLPGDHLRATTRSKHAFFGRVRAR